MNEHQSATWNNTAVVIPAYEASRHLSSLFERLGRVCGLERVYVVDDGSVDDTAELCKRAGVRLLRHAANRGKGAALRTGLSQALTDGWEWGLTLDADLQHEPESMPRFLAEQRRSGTDLVYGRRCFSRRLMPWPRIASNRLTSLLVSIACRRRVYDSQCGFRLYRLNRLRFAELRTERYQFETEALFMVARGGGRLSFTNVRTVYGNEKSHIRHMRDIKNFVRILLHA
ncbi:MAG: glycosyltransferase family 2 protein [Candidatus Cloacimonetes bacterium]|nr:glycosyltransferase family 2 protein [Candidatus Cloacimonadota bacterium]